MKKYIVKQKAISALINEANTHSNPVKKAYTRAAALIEQITAEDVQPVIHAHWRRGEEKGFRTYNPLWYCSNCGGQIRYDTRMRQYQKIKRPVWEVNAFCRKCGAKMEQED